VLVDTSTSWGRRIHTGIHNYERKHGPWQVFVEARGMEERLRVPAGWKGHGIIARVGSLAMARELEALGLPVVNVSGIELDGVRFPRVSTDLEASAELAVRHFLDRGYRHFAYFSLLGLAYVANHQAAFFHAVKRAGGDFASYAVRPVAGAEPDWNLDLAKLADWLRSLPKPVAVLAWNPSSGREIVYACQQAGLLVPEDVAVLSGADDDLLCEVLQVPLSAILVAAEQIGYQAAAMLDRLLRGGSAPAQPYLIAPLSIVTRRSTDTLAIRDQVLVRALGFIRDKGSRAIQVVDVARHAGVSRRVLERHFHHLLGRSPASEIRRVRLERAKTLLAESDLSIPDVAAAAGFGSPEYLACVLRAETGKTPLRYRKDIRGR
jgi:LacI family transcriptional regulator